LLYKLTTTLVVHPYAGGASSLKQVVFYINSLRWRYRQLYSYTTPMLQIQTVAL